jgi:hypothetical protein
MEVQLNMGREEGLPMLPPDPESAFIAIFLDFGMSLGVVDGCIYGSNYYLGCELQV